MRRGIMTALSVVVVALLAGLTVVPMSALAVPTAPVQTSARGDYLSLGDSLAAGYQPGAGDAKRAGYSGPVASQANLTLTNLACTGETVATMIAGGRCRYRAGSQLAAARAFLSTHPRTSLITVSIGANDVRGCVEGTHMRTSCVQDRLTFLRDRLPTILSTLRAAAPQARIIVLDYYNPYLAAQLQGASRLASINSTWLQFRLNSTIGEATRQVSGRMARVATAFESNRVGTNLTRICAWTWMCSRGDIHPNSAGYGVIASAVTARFDR